jgi:PleD family two-component response regulator
MVILIGCDRDKSRSLAERLRVSIAERPVRVGVASKEPEKQPEADALLRDADLARYSAKAAGRNRVSLSGSSSEGFGNVDSAEE